ncbi:MAG: glycine cleavage system protein T [SAR202 cluster bacterium Io17-Chloro-G3]|nr:MAG: glycine cleavage system protein T [SAR202 cluster bacterium Io17-Chloro-G3]
MRTGRPLNKTALNSCHIDSGARLVPFAGWEMPIQYSGIFDEVKAVRSSAGIFDVSHMGRLEISGPGSESTLNRVLSVNVSALLSGRAKYNVVCNENGGIIDDCIVYRRDETSFLLIPNASNCASVAAWLRENSGQRTIDIIDTTEDTIMIALQGPNSQTILTDHTDIDLDSIRPFRAVTCVAFGAKAFIARTGYTGEDGFEIILSAKEGPNAWRHLETSGAIPCGLGARDVLRLEAGLLLHGNDMDQTVNPYEAGLQTFVESDREGYIARDALISIQKGGPSRRLIGFVIEGKKIARGGCPIMDDGEEIGNVTSGVPSPTLGVNIGMGFVRSDRAEPGTFIDINIRGEEVAAKVTRLPFYRRNKKS